jgi:hypothetical protein
MKATSRLAPLLGAPLIVAALSGAVAAPAVAATTPAAILAPSVANIPATAQPLVAKIAHAAVTSERYSVTLTGTVPSKQGGRSKTAKKVTIGEASLSPLRAKVYREGGSGPLAEVGIGSTVYINDAALTGKRAKPWVKSPGTSATTLFPFHGGSSSEVDAGGSGPYAELLNLLATANDVQVVGPATVAGQQTTEITATAQPLALVKDGPTGLSEAETSTRIEVFVSAAGVPLRVARTYGPDANAPVETVEVLALNVRVSVKAPPKRKTVSKRFAEKRIENNGVTHKKK